MMYRIIVICHKLSLCVKWSGNPRFVGPACPKFFLCKCGKDMLSFLFLAGSFWVYSQQIQQESIKGK